MGSLACVTTAKSKGVLPKLSLAWMFAPLSSSACKIAGFWL